MQKFRENPEAFTAAENEQLVEVEKTSGPRFLRLFFVPGVGVVLLRRSPRGAYEPGEKYGATCILGPAVGIAFSGMGQQGGGIDEKAEDHDEKCVGT